MRLQKYKPILILAVVLTVPIWAGQFITNIPARKALDLNGMWNIIIDPYETGYYNYRYEPDANGYFRNQQPRDKSDRVEYSFQNGEQLHVPGDWNTQMEKLFLYEGTVWYHRDFDLKKVNGQRYWLHFGAVNYQAHVYVNGEAVGYHEGGFTPFSFEVTHLLQDGKNFVVVKADNKRFREAVPTVNTDWFNYGGITRSVKLVEVPATFIEDFTLNLASTYSPVIAGWIQLSGSIPEQLVTVHIPEAGLTVNAQTDSGGRADFRLTGDIMLWSPDNPKLYDVIIQAETDTLQTRMGFRSISTEGYQILLNGEAVFLRGISIHEEAPLPGGGRAYGPEQAAVLLNWAKELGCNFVRLAHYPHNEAMTQIADELGLMVWSEIPVYWTILWDNPEVLEKAKDQLRNMITRDRNRASIILWSVANETPLSKSRLSFLKELIVTARELDHSRLLTAALERHYIDDHTLMIDDPLGAYLDVLGCNEYLGWYDGLPAKCAGIEWQSAYNKPVIFSEFGGGALYGLHGDSLTRWTEEFQADLYRQNLEMLNRIPFAAGMSPWILKDFRSPRRPLPEIQDFWNRKGLISDEGQRKQAFYILQEFYQTRGEGLEENGKD